MRFGILGPLEVWTSTGQSVRVPEVKVRALLAHLLVNRGRRVSAGRLIEDLWGENLPANPAGVLRSKVSQLRRVLDDAERGGRDLIEFRSAGYLLRTDAQAVDADEFTAAVERARGTAETRAKAALLADSLALWRGPALADFADEGFARAAIARLDEQRLNALQEQAEAWLALGEPDRLAGELAEVVAQHPLHERLRALLMRALYVSGRQGDALDCYQDLRVRLREELGVEPGPELVALHQSILRREPVPGSRPPAPEVSRPRTNLPTPLTELVGRVEAVALTRKLLERGRLVTITGMGGAGKTRLALATAAELVDHFPSGVWLVELTALGQPAAGPDEARGADPAAVRAAVVEMISTVLGLHDQPGGARLAAGADEDVRRLVAALRDRRVLLVLDNCEHVVEPVAQLCSLLLAAAPSLRVLATSREPLRVTGELLHPLPPLELPGPDEGTDPERLLRYSAIHLFVSRVAASSPGFALTTDNAAAVVEICRRLDGLPLALELVATRVRALGVQPLVRLLDDRLLQLSSGKRDVPARHQTLRGMIDWSWSLLAPAEQAVLRRLALHSGGCTLSAAAEVCSGGGVVAEEVPDLLARLVDCSLVVAAEGVDGPHYRMLESVAAYSVERLREAGETAEWQRRHDEHYLSLAERADQRLRGREQRRWLLLLDAETVNLRAALHSAIRRGDAAMAVRLCCALAWYWVLRGRLGEGRRSFAAALAVAGPVPEGTRTTALLWWAGMTAMAGEDPAPVLARVSGRDAPRSPADRRGAARAEWLLASVTPSDVDRPAGEDKLSRALATFRELGDDWGVAVALSSLAWISLLRGDFAALRRDAERSLALFRELGDDWGILQATDPLAALAYTTGDHDRAVQLCSDGLRTARDLGLWPQFAYYLNELGRLALLAGDCARARDLHERARTLAVELSNLAVAQYAEQGLAVVARRQGDYELAERHLRPLLDAARQAEWGEEVTSLLAELGFVAEQRGDAEAAFALHREGYEAARTTGDQRAVARALEGLAGAHNLIGRHDVAARLLGCAAAAQNSMGIQVPAAERYDVDRVTDAARAALGAACFEAEFAVGGASRPDECVPA
ncbi:BTAD domain-containing putative transcriptional regulator [Saccharothrix obliqua]|uniref:BTAD domain-containing putative transcriptional regulator n=1 Tax=Saccharothrix obliqua TaxID=2861747 RepID=UPI001C6047D5|nr:BTAD domain-containing putative transcriptional regulator [Saccharothrix obliqua]MBW4721836.1 winged helix-turn-helix domain-containing protein [Saccharothrix obliqua]